MYKLNAAPSFSSTDKQKLHCVIIDDDPDDREILELALYQVNPSYSCTTFRNAKDAMRYLLTGDFVPDFVFLDLNMPGMSGRELLKELRKHKDLQKVPIIICSTSSNVVDVMQTSCLGATHYMTKPYSLKQFVFLLNQLIKNRTLPYYLNHLCQT